MMIEINIKLFVIQFEFFLFYAEIKRFDYKLDFII